MRRLISLSFILLVIQLTGGYALAATRDEVRQEVESRFKITKPGFLGDYREIGSVLVVKKDGLRANRPAASFKPNVIMNGQVAETGGGDVPPGGNADGRLKAGDRLYLYDVRTGDDYVQLDIFTVKTYIVTGTRGPTPLQASVRFRYGEGLSGITPDRIMEDIADWFDREGEAAMPVRVYKPAGGPGAKTEPATTATVRLGQSEEEVTAILGEPDKKILLGKKAVFVYGTLKVVFVDGKVTDAY